MDALRRLFGGGGRAAEAGDENPAAPAPAPAPAPDASAAEAGGAPATAAPPTADEIEAEERARELELLRAEQDRLDELVLRQQRYADRSWVPPSQGGPRRSDDAEKSAGEDR